MSACLVCHGKRSKTELVNKVFEMDERFVLVEGIPATVCQQCGERTFSSDTVERTREVLSNGGRTAKTRRLEVYDYA